MVLDTRNKIGLTPEEVTEDQEIKEILRQEHWRRARQEVGARVGVGARMGRMWKHE